MTDQNIIAQDFVAQLDPSIDEIPRMLLISELLSQGLEKDSPLILCLGSMKEDSITIAQLKGLTDPPPMELTESDRAKFSSIMDPMLPNQGVLISMWKSQLSDLDLAHAHPFMQDIYNRPESAELTREQVHEIAVKSGLALDDLCIPKAAAATQKQPPAAEEQKPAPASAMPETSNVGAMNPDMGAGNAPPSVSGGQNTARPQSQGQNGQRQAAPMGGPQYGSQGGGQSSSSGVGALITDLTDIAGKVLGAPFAIAKSAFAKANENRPLASPVNGSVASVAPHAAAATTSSASSTTTANESGDEGAIPGNNEHSPGASVSAKSIVDEITTLTQQLRENPGADTAKALTEALSFASNKINSAEDLGEEDQIALKDALVSLKEATDNGLTEDGMTDEEKKTFSESIAMLTKALMDLFARLFGKSKDKDEAKDEDLNMSLA